KRLGVAVELVPLDRVSTRRFALEVAASVGRRRVLKRAVVVERTPRSHDHAPAPTVGPQLAAREPWQVPVGERRLLGGRIEGEGQAPVAATPGMPALARVERDDADDPRADRAAQAQLEIAGDRGVADGDALDDVPGRARVDGPEAAARVNRATQRQ